MPVGMGDHIDAETLERYALGRLAEPERRPVEEHLLICQPCRTRLVQAEQFVRAMREGFERNGWGKN
jgi:anti-sigma factor ChrR (cupin superfamily)